MKSLQSSLFVLLGACCYGIHASIVKIGIGNGLTISEITGSQYIVGFLLLLLALPFTKKVKVNKKQVIQLLGLGLLIGLTGVFYGQSLAKVPASIAVVMLFQFTWIGLLIEAIYLKAFPTQKKIISVLFLWIGTLLAGGIGGHSNFVWGENIVGITYGLLAAITFALFIFFSGKVAEGVPTIQRSVLTVLGGILVITLVFRPEFISQPSQLADYWVYAIIVGLFGTIIPVVFFAIGTPHLDSSISTIVGAAELPAAIIAAMIMLHEEVTVLQTIGIVLILIGIMIPQLRFTFWKQRKQFG